MRRANLTTFAFVGSAIPLPSEELWHQCLFSISDSHARDVVGGFVQQLHCLRQGTKRNFKTATEPLFVNEVVSPNQCQRERFLPPETHIYIDISLSFCLLSSEEITHPRPFHEVPELYMYHCHHAMHIGQIASRFTVVSLHQQSSNSLFAMMPRSRS